MDLRDDLNGNLYLSHNPFESGELFEDYLREYRHGLMILNIKSERIEIRAMELLKKYSIREYFFLDSSFPMIHLLSEQGEKSIALRISEYEGMDTLRNMKGNVNWVWIDCFSRIPVSSKEVDELHAMGYRLCMVSPELQGRQEDVEDYAAYIKDNNWTLDAVCSKFYNLNIWKQCCKGEY